MTVIVWDGTTLAADKAANSSGIQRTVTKVFRLNADELVAFAGRGYEAQALRAWLQGPRTPETFPPLRDPDDVIAWLVHRNGTILRYDGGRYLVPYEDRTFADGSGRDFALAALHLGCDAVRAVQVAVHFDINCGVGIDALRFEPTTTLTPGGN